MYLRYSSSVVAPMQCSSPRASIGLRRLALRPSRSPFGLAGADDVVKLVDEEDDATLGLLHFVEDGLQALFEFAAILGASDQRAQVEREDDLVLQALGHVAAHDALREALDDGGLAYAGFADEDGIVLGLAGKNANGAAGSRRRGQ